MAEKNIGLISKNSESFGSAIYYKNLKEMNPSQAFGGFYNLTLYPLIFV